MIQLDLIRLKRESIYHIYGTYTGEVLTPIRVEPALAPKAVIQNHNSPTLTILSGPTAIGPFDEVATVKNGRFATIEAFGLWFTANLIVNRNYDFYAYIKH